MPSSYCYRLKVLRELLTHGYGGSKVDEDGSGDRFPLRQGAGTGLQIGCPRNRNLQQRNKSQKNGTEGFGKYGIL